MEKRLGDKIRDAVTIGTIIPIVISNMTVVKYEGEGCIILCF